MVWVCICAHEWCGGWFSMSPTPRLHHHDIMTIVGLLLTYRQYIIYIRTVRTCVMLVH